MSTKTFPNQSQSPITNTIIIITYFFIRIGLEIKLNSNPSSLFHSIINRPEIVTPITGWKECMDQSLKTKTFYKYSDELLFRLVQEGVYLFKNGYDPYQGDIFHQSPLLLYLFSIVSNPISISLVYAFIDCCSAYLSLSLFRFKSTDLGSGASSSWKDHGWVLDLVRNVRDWQFLICYLCFPLQLFTSLSKSTIVFTNLFILISLKASLKNQLALSMFSLSIATHLSVYPILLLPSTISIICEKKHGLNSTWSTQSTTIFQSISIYVSHFGTLIWLFPFRISKSVFLSHLNVNQNLNPNLGLHWYFSIEIFDHFRLFFNLVFQLHLLIYLIPFLIKFKNERVFGFVLMNGIVSIFKSYPSIGDVTFANTLFLLTYPELISHLRHPILTITFYIYSLSLLPTFYYQWIHLGSGNVNFYYASTLVWSVSNGFFWIDNLSSLLKLQFQKDLKRLKELDGIRDWVLDEEVEAIVQS